MSQTFIRRAKRTVDGASAFTPSSHNPPLCKMKHARRDSQHHQQEKQKQTLPNLRNIKHLHHCRLLSGNTLTFKLTRWFWLGLKPHVPVTEREHFLCALISGNRTRVDSRKEENHKEIVKRFIFFVCPVYRWPKPQQIKLTWSWLENEAQLIPQMDSESDVNLMLYV